MLLFLRLVALAGLPFALACGGPPAQAPASDSSPAAPPQAAPPSTAEAPPPPRPRPLDLTNNCAKEIHLYYGEQPGDGKGERATVNPGGYLQVPRDAEGNVVVWVVDEKGFGLASVHVSKRMKHVVLDGSCGKIDAN